MPTRSKPWGASLRLCSLDINGLRSIDATKLEDCGNFNVLIGKNNSGKSNVLAAIDHFFRFLSRGTVATVNSTLRTEVDHFQRDTSRSISITATVEPSDEELQDLANDIQTEFPQVRDALPDPLTFTRLEFQLLVSSSDSTLSYLKSIRWLGNTDSSRQGARSILRVEQDTAREIALREDESKTARKHSELVGRFASTFDDDDFERSRSRRIPFSPASSRLQRDLGPTRMAEIAGIIQRSSDAEEARTSLEGLGVALRTRSEEIEEGSLENSLQAFAGPLNSVPEYVFRLLRRLSNNSVLHLEDQRKPIGPDEADRLLSLKVSRGGDVMLRNIQSVVSSLLGVKIDAFSVEKSLRANETVARTAAAELDVDDFLVQVNGSGIREALRLILDLEFGQPQILLVEEPEVHLHPALEVAMMRYLKEVSSRTQVFLTTHSTNFLDTGDMNNVYMVRSQDSSTVERLDVAGAESEIPKELGIRLSSVFMFDRLMFVEGVSDEHVFRTFADLLDINLSQENLGFVIMGGARNFTHYAAQSTLSLLSRRNVKSTFVVDRDEKDQSQFDKLTEQLGTEASLHVLQRRELENYLIHPDILAAYIVRRRAEAGLRIAQVSSEEIGQALNEEADKLRELSIAKRVAAKACSVHRADQRGILERWREEGIEAASSNALAEVEESIRLLRESLHEAVEEARRTIEQDWDTRKLEIVPGHELIDNVFKRYDLRFKKDRDAGQIAQMMRGEHIPQELKLLVRTAVASN